ncbi:MAG: hypothetical protein R3C11_23190 [Planctomycetaceae bacterium]
MLPLCGLPLLLALALQSAQSDDKTELEAALKPEADPADRIRTLERLYEELGVFEKAEALVDKSRFRAQALADEVESDDFRQLLHFLVETILEVPSEAKQFSDPPNETLVQLNLRPTLKQGWPGQSRSVVRVAEQHKSDDSGTIEIATSSLPM